MELRLSSRVVKISAAIFLFTSLKTFALTDTDKVIFSKTEASLVSGHVTRKITVELAETEDQHERGLMFRKSLGRNKGMLFIFPDEEPRSFWMKNTLIDLSIGYFNKEKKLIDIQEMKAVTTIMQTDIPTYTSLGPAQYALEMPANWFTQNKIAQGAILNLKKSKK